MVSTAQNCVGFWDSDPAPSPVSLVVRDFLPLEIAVSRGPHFYYSHSDVLRFSFYTVVAWVSNRKSLVEVKSHIASTWIKERAKAKITSCYRPSRSSHSCTGRHKARSRK